MKTIKFSADYKKLPKIWNGTQAKLVGVFQTTVETIMAMPSFWKYDTEHPGGYYKLDFNKAMILVFIHYNTGLPFTTIRRSYPRKFYYYNDAIGETFTLVDSREKE